MTPASPTAPLVHPLPAAFDASRGLRRRFMSTPSFLATGVIAALALAVPASLVHARQGSGSSHELAAQSDATRIVVVTQDDVALRSGASKSYYPFGKLKSGDMLQVTGAKFMWSRVSAVGPAFNELYGLIKYEKTAAGNFKLTDGGRSGVTLARTAILAPDVSLQAPHEGSWKALLWLDPSTEVEVFETFESGADIVHRVRLPEKAVGWIASTSLRDARPEELRQWDLALSQWKRDLSSRGGSAKMAASEPVAPAADRSVPQVGSAQQPVTPAPAIVADEPAATTDEAASSAVASTEPALDIPVTNLPVDAANPAQALPPVDDASLTDKTATLEDLESRLESVQQESAESVETAELEPLRQLYLNLAEREKRNARVSRYAKSRAEQLRLWMEIQAQQIKLAELRQKATSTSNETRLVGQAIARSGQYTVIGRLAASTIYDGRNLPRLLRLQDPSTGRTVAYLLAENAKFDLLEMSGQLVGIVGEKQYDAGLRLHVIEPSRIDLLAPQAEQ